MANERTGKPGWGKTPKVRRDAKLKNLPEEAQEEMWLMLHPVDPVASPPLPPEEVLVHVQEEYGITASQSTFYEWHSYWHIQREIIAARKLADQSTAALAAKPGFTARDSREIGQIIFTAKMLREENWKGFSTISKLGIADEKAAIEREKLSAASKSKLETALDALMAEIEMNPRALELFTAMKEALAKG
jgi:hypothetical protein